MAKTAEQLLIENEALRSRLQEMEGALDAIRNGEVDAIMVTGSQGEQVYAISSADTPYRTFIEEMNEGAVTLAKDHTILYCNQRFAEIVETPADKVIGSSMNRFISPKDKIAFEKCLANLTAEGRDVIVVSLSNAAYIRVSIHLLPPYLQGDSYILIATDITDLKRKEQELRNTTAKLINHIEALRELRIINISETLDIQGTKNQLKATNSKLAKEIIKLNRLVEELRKEQRKSNR